MSNTLLKKKNDDLIENIYGEARKKRFFRKEDETRILNRIEEVRQELYDLLNHHENVDLSEDRIIAMSQYLDRLLAAYVRNIGREHYEKK
jgi:hypothetical protein